MVLSQSQTIAKTKTKVILLNYFRQSIETTLKGRFCKWTFQASEMSDGLKGMLVLFMGNNPFTKYFLLRSYQILQINVERQTAPTELLFTRHKGLATAKRMFTAKT